ncbi:MAG: nucleotidyltransferase domain-containing protein [Ignavibacteriae bacterium]|nr:nucleotidyltransferase domain-containing protein [Ignavibacteriota bacterium]
MLIESQSPKPDRVLVAKELADAIHSYCRDAKILLYGSTANRTNLEESDVDMLVEVPDSEKKSTLEQVIQDLAWKTGMENNIVFQVWVYGSSEIWKTPRRSSPFITSVYQSGISL